MSVNKGQLQEPHISKQETGYYRRIFHETCTDVYTFKDTENVTLLTVRNYKVSTSFGPNTARLCHINRNFDIGAESTMLKEALVERD